MTIVLALLVSCLLPSASSYVLRNQPADDFSYEYGDATDPCSSVFCGNGRECHVTDGQAQCVCLSSCPSHYKPVCGNDGITYNSHCEMHRAACIRGYAIRKHANGACPDYSPPDVATPTAPLVCYEIERDQLRQMLIDWMRVRVEAVDWFESDSSYVEMVSENFRSCDQNGDDKLDASEFMRCVERNDTIRDFPSQEDAGALRGLCVDALIVMSDADLDWKLDLEEFRRCFDPDYEPPRKSRLPPWTHTGQRQLPRVPMPLSSLPECSLENRLYDDGAESRVGCNLCVCACGNWVCTATACDEEEMDAFKVYDVHQGPLPTREERRRLLQGFLAAELIDVDRVEEEVPVPVFGGTLTQGQGSPHLDHSGIAHDHPDHDHENCELCNSRVPSLENLNVNIDSLALSRASGHVDRHGVPHDHTDHNHEECEFCNGNVNYEALLQRFRNGELDVNLAEIPTEDGRSSLIEQGLSDAAQIRQNVSMGEGVQAVSLSDRPSQQGDLTHDVRNVHRETVAEPTPVPNDHTTDFDFAAPNFEVIDIRLEVNPADGHVENVDVSETRNGGRNVESRVTPDRDVIISRSSAQNRSDSTAQPTQVVESGSIPTTSHVTHTELAPVGNEAADDTPQRQRYRISVVVTQEDTQIIHNTGNNNQENRHSDRRVSAAQRVTSSSGGGRIQQ